MSEDFLREVAVAVEEKEEEKKKRQQQGVDTNIAILPEVTGSISREYRDMLITELALDALERTREALIRQIETLLKQLRDLNEKIRKLQTYEKIQYLLGEESSKS